MRLSRALISTLAVFSPLALAASDPGSPVLPRTNSSAIVALLRAQAATPAPKAKAAYALPDGPGKEEAERVCSACHAPNVFTHQRHDQAGWSKIINDMIAKGADGSDDDFAKILTYLVANFGPDSPAPAGAPPATTPQTPPPPPPGPSR